MNENHSTSHSSRNEEARTKKRHRSHKKSANKEILNNIKGQQKQVRRDQNEKRLELSLPVSLPLNLLNIPTETFRKRTLKLKVGFDSTNHNLKDDATKHLIVKHKDSNVININKDNLELIKVQDQQKTKVTIMDAADNRKLVRNENPELDIYLNLFKNKRNVNANPMNISCIIRNSSHDKLLDKDEMAKGLETTAEVKAKDSQARLHLKRKYDITEKKNAQNSTDFINDYPNTAFSNNKPTCIESKDTETSNSAIGYDSLQKVQIPTEYLPIAKHNLPVIVLPEREKYKAMQKIAPSINNAYTIRKEKTYVTVGNQTDDTFIVTREEREILQFIEANNLNKEKLLNLTSNTATHHNIPSIDVEDKNTCEDFKILANKYSESNKDFIATIYRVINEDETWPKVILNMCLQALESKTKSQSKQPHDNLTNVQNFKLRNQESSKVSPVKSVTVVVPNTQPPGYHPSQNVVQHEVYPQYCYQYQGEHYTTARLPTSQYPEYNRTDTTNYLQTYYPAPQVTQETIRLPMTQYKSVHTGVAQNSELVNNNMWVHQQHPKGSHNPQLRQTYEGVGALKINTNRPVMQAPKMNTIRPVSQVPDYHQERLRLQFERQKQYEFWEKNRNEWQRQHQH